jgi:putative secretion ATPase (PEP-CTERM system associated)
MLLFRELSGMYDKYYKFSGRPFQLTPDPQFYFESGTHRKAMSYLGYGLAQGEGFIVITGEIGAGKTTLVGHLMATIDPRRLTAVKIVSTQVGGDDMLRLTAQAFGIDTDHVEKSHILSRIEAFLHHQARAGRRSLLIVDEAQNLSAPALEELRMLSNFQLGGQSLLQIFLLGQPEFRDQINGAEALEQLRQRIIATHHLEPMQAGEVAPYIEHRLKVVGWAGDPRFTPDAYRLLAKASGGLPRRLNAIVSRVLLLGAIDHLDIIDERVVEAVVADLAIGMSGDDAVDDMNEDDAEAADFVDYPVGDASDRADHAPTPDAVAGAMPDAMPGGMSGVGASADLDDLQALQAEVHALNAAVAAQTRDGDAHAADRDGPLEDAGRNGAAAARIGEIEARLVRLEQRIEEQDEVLRRMLSKLIQWVERDAINGPFSNRAA